MLEEPENPEITTETFQLYNEYCEISQRDELETHLINIKKKLQQQGKINYKCIQKFRFAYSRIWSRFFYQDILQYGQQHANDKPYLLDIGCCTGTDLRKLFIDGYPKDCLIGMDMESSYIDIGYDQFKDNASTCPIQFIIDNIFTHKHQHSYLYHIVHAGSVFHLFTDSETARQFLLAVKALMKPTGGMLVGGHVCAEQSVSIFRASTQSHKFYLGIGDFKDLLASTGFSNIKIELLPREIEKGETTAEQQNFIAYWISFSCILYNKDE